MDPIEKAKVLAVVEKLRIEIDRAKETVAASELDALDELSARLLESISLSLYEAADTARDLERHFNR